MVTHPGIMVEKCSLIKAEKKNKSIIGKNICISAANFKYPTVKTKELKRIPIREIADDDYWLFMWVTNPHLAQGIELGKAIIRSPIVNCV